MNQTTLTRKSILAAACFCFATSLAAQTRQDSTSAKDIVAAQEPQIIASLTRPDPGHGPDESQRRIRSHSGSSRSR
jgi:hypothetical protein